MEAFNMAGESNLVFIINELDKATAGKGNGANPADVLLTLLDNLGFTDNYMECLIPTVGVYPIATANFKDQISSPLLSRFAVIDIPDYTHDEKKTILSTLTETIIAGKTKDGKYAYFVYNMSEKNPDNVAIANQSIVLRVPVTRIAGDPLLEKAKAKARQ